MAKTIKLKVHDKMEELTQECAERSGMLYDEYILSCIRDKNEKIKTELENKYKG